MHFDSAALTRGTQHTLDLGGGRTLVLDDLVGRFSTEELEFAAGLVRRCCEHVHTVTGIEVRGDVRYFLLPIDLDASSYEFEFRSDDPDRWAWVGFIAFDGAEGIARDGDYSLDFYEALVLTLPHELGETALSSVPTLQRENEGDQVNYGTRWFCDGGAQVIGSLFAQREFPQLWRADRASRALAAATRACRSGKARRWRRFKAAANAARSRRFDWHCRASLIKTPCL